MRSGYKVLVIAWLILLGKDIHAQIISNQVINAGGSFRQANGFSLTDNVGEAFTEPLNATAQMMITQGFLQPMINIGVMVLKQDVSCSTRQDGSIRISFSTLNRVHSEEYIWSSNVSCPSATCGSAVSNLAPGVYSVIIVSTYTTNSNEVRVDSLRTGPIMVSASSEPCLVNVFSGVTPNGDNVNDYLYIEHIDLFPNNQVSLYNRWGTEVYSARGYDNENVRWPDAQSMDKLVSGTYFYIVELGDGSRPLKGWVELLKN